MIAFHSLCVIYFNGNQPARLFPISTPKKINIHRLLRIPSIFELNRDMRILWFVLFFFETPHSLSLLGIRRYINTKTRMSVIERDLRIAPVIQIQTCIMFCILFFSSYIHIYMPHCRFIKVDV